MDITDIVELRFGVEGKHSPVTTLATGRAANQHYCVTQGTQQRSGRRTVGMKV